MSKKKMTWEHRKKQLMASLEKDETKLVRDLSKRYLTMADDISREIDSYFNTYGKDNVIEYADLFLDLSDTDKNLLFTNIDNFINKYPQYAHLAPIRTSVYKLNRLQGLETSIYTQLLEMGAIEQSEVENHLSHQVNHIYGELGNVLRGGNYNLVSREVAMLLNKPSWTDGDNYSGHIWKSKANLMNAIEKDLVNGFIRGDSYDSIVKKMRERLGKEQTNNLKRLVRTEGTFIANEAMVLSAQQIGNYDEYEYSAVHDSKTSQICRSLDGHRFSFEDREVGVNFPPMHPNCRSTFTLVIADEWADWTDEEINELRNDPAWSDDEVDEILAGRMNDQRPRTSDITKFNTVTDEQFKEMSESTLVSKDDLDKLKDKKNGYIDTSNSFRINRHLRGIKSKLGKGKLSEESKETINLLSKIIKDNVLDADIKAYRYVNKNWLENVFPGEDIHSLSKNKPEFPDKGFVSTSLVEDKNILDKRDIKMNILVPKGSNAFVTDNFTESEMILDKGGIFKVMDAKSIDGKTVIDLLYKGDEENG